MTNVQTGELLSFQDYTPVHDESERSARIDVEAVHTSAYNPPIQSRENTQNQHYTLDSGDALNTDPQGNHNFWTIEYYQKYFDVQSNDVIERIISSLVPQRVSPDYFDNTIRAKPDLYGPIWISVTLIFTIAISGNIASYLQHANSNYHWRYDFHLVSYAATAIVCYVWLVPLALWAAIKWTSRTDVDDLENPTEPTMISLFCLYGYSLSVYVPVSVLWTIQVSWLQWMLVITAAVVSGAVLIYWLRPALKRSTYTFILVGSILAAHFLLAAGFMLYFFHVPKSYPAAHLIVSSTEQTLRSISPNN